MAPSERPNNTWNLTHCLELLDILGERIYKTTVDNKVKTLLFDTKVPLRGRTRWRHGPTLQHLMSGIRQRRRQDGVALD